MLTLRAALPDDTPLTLAYIRELAEFEREPEAAVAIEADIHRYAFSEHPLVWVTMAEWDGQPAGFALWFLNFSTWQGKPGIYLVSQFAGRWRLPDGLGQDLVGGLDPDKGR